MCACALNSRRFSGSARQRLLFRLVVFFSFFFFATHTHFAVIYVTSVCVLNEVLLLSRCLVVALVVMYTRTHTHTHRHAHSYKCVWWFFASLVCVVDTKLVMELASTSASTATATATARQTKSSLLSSSIIWSNAKRIELVRFTLSLSYQHGRWRGSAAAQQQRRSGNFSFLFSVMLCGASFKLWQASASQHFFNWYIYASSGERWGGWERLGERVVVYRSSIERQHGVPAAERERGGISFVTRILGLVRIICVCVSVGIDVNITSFVWQQ